MAAVVRKSAVGNATIRVKVPICTNSASTVIFLPAGAALAIRLAASVALRPDADTVSDLDPFSSLTAYLNRDADDLMADATRITRLALAIPINIARHSLR